MKGRLNSYGFRSFERGEIVNIPKMPGVTGQVIGENGWGRAYLVRLSDAVDTIWFEDFELTTYDIAGAKGGHNDEPEMENGNVINLAQARTAGRA